MSDKLALIDALAAANLQPLWDRYMNLMTLEPKPIDWPIAWPWASMQGVIERAVAEVGMEDAERRVLLFCHPAFAPNIYTTTNLSAGLQILEPGEHADAHRHTASALRFVMEGEGAVTWVDGKPCPMSEGDLILTPSWCWHEHRNLGDQRVVWFDGLDVPIAHQLRSIFLEFGPRREVPLQVDDRVAQAGVLPAGLPADYQKYSMRYRYGAAEIREALDLVSPSADGTKMVRYVNPATGGPVMPTLDCYAMRLPTGTQTRPMRTTGNAVVVVASGAGKTVVGDTSFLWQKGDVFTLPHWHWLTHCASEKDSQLFLMTDYSYLEAMGYLRTEHGN
ncbi:cupin domain-containing protein [Pusillimonas sp.]|uniref:cupin domain-containing protein n=1 Tax=Pusillimonas sp. TaxID=3040095 RepID=UPI0029A33F18|nr:cupin domain-containing protein [Pusillimonas sp.]MDX3895577.1 cupin domain-containing protein [Pusillimonas sp.]